MKRSFFDRNALFVLMIVFFFVPFGMRGARMAINGMRNEVKDWLPDSFEETEELEVFRKHFWGEGFIVVSWDGCRGTLDDDRFRWMVDKFFRELPPSMAAEAAELDASIAQHKNAELDFYTRRLPKESPLSERDFVGNQLGLYATGEYHKDWGGLGEKWMRGDADRWYYILPNGDIHQWEGTDTIIMAAFRQLRRRFFGPEELQGTLVARTGMDGPWYYEQPRRLEADMFKSVITGPSVVSDLVREGGALEDDPEAAIERLKGWLFGPDGEQTCMVVTLSERGRQHIHRAVGRGLLGKPRGKLLELAAESGLQTPPVPSSLPPLIDKLFAQPETDNGPLLHLGGPPVDNVAIDEEGQATLVRLVGVSSALGIFIAWLSVRNLPVVIMLSFVGAVSAICSLSFVWWGGSILDAVLMSMPSLVYVLGLSGAVHIVNYYKDTTESMGYPGSPMQALSHGWKPCTLAAVTTALGLVSLATSEIVPIRKFGLFSAIGVVFTLVLLFTFLPAALTLWPPKNFGVMPGEKNRSKSFADVCTAFWKAIGRFAVRRHGVVTAVCLVVLIGAAMGLSRMSTSIQLLNLFDHESKIVRDYQWMEKNLGNLVPMEVLVWIQPEAMSAAEVAGEAQLADADERYGINFLERMELTEHIRTVIDAYFGPNNGNITGKAMMASTFVPPRPEAGGNSMQATLRNTYSRQLVNYREDLFRSDCFRQDPESGAEIWRLSLRLSALNNVDYGNFVAQLQTAIEPVMYAYQYRRDVLESLDQARADKGYRGGKVLLLGVPFGKSRLAGTPTDEFRQQKEKEAAEAENEQPEIKEVNQSLVFSLTLRSLLRNAAVNVRDWHDPRFELPEDFESRIGEFDCVVVAGDDPRYDMDRLKEMAASFVDVRQHEYLDNSHPTALARKQPIGTMYTGLVPIVYKAQRTLLNSLIKSTGWAFVAISIVMVLVLRSFSAGSVSMLPNVFPVILVFGFMGWAKILVDIGTMMTASVAMGVAVDDTVHFLTWFRRGLDEGRDRRSAIMLAYDRCATAMTQTTLIGGLGLSVFAFSTFTPTARFGILMLTLMVTALVGDLIFLPAILAGPAGRVFSKRERKRKPLRVGLPDEEETATSGSSHRPHASHTDESRRQST